MRHENAWKCCPSGCLRLTFTLVLALIPIGSAVAVPPDFPDIEAMKDEMDQVMDRRRAILEEIQALPDRSPQSRNLWD